MCTGKKSMWLIVKEQAVKFMICALASFILFLVGLQQNYYAVAFSQLA